MRGWSRREVLGFLDRIEPVLERMDHFELLDVKADAGEDDIQAAFHAMAAALHPDRHRDLDPAQRERLTIVYARIAEAYRVLRAAGPRQAYRAQRARATAGPAAVVTPAPAPSWLAGTPPDRAAPPEEGGQVEADSLARLSPRAQSLYRRARAAQGTGDRTSAILNLRLALAAHPTSTFLREALARLEGTPEPGKPM